MCKILGYPRHELIGMNNREFMDENNSKKVFKTFNQVFTSEKALKGFDWEVIQKDGTRRYLDTSVSLIKNGDGRKIGFRGIARDISGRKIVEGKMKESESRYKALFDRSLDCVFIHDFNGNFIDANEAALQMLGYERKDISSLHIKSIISEDQLSIADQVLKELKETGQQKGVSVFKLKHKDGHYVDVETKSTVIMKDGKPYAIQGIGRDITQKLKMENRLPPYCQCGGVIKDDGVFFGEPIPSDVLQGSQREALKCDLMLICGTSAVVYPFASLPEMVSSATIIIEINAEPTSLTGRISEYLIQGKIGAILPQLIDKIKEIQKR